MLQSARDKNFDRSKIYSYFGSCTLMSMITCSHHYGCGARQSMVAYMSWLLDSNGSFLSHHSDAGKLQFSQMNSFIPEVRAFTIQSPHPNTLALYNDVLGTKTSVYES